MARRTATTYRASRTVTTDTEEGRTGSTAAAEEEKGMNFADALSVTTTFLLLAAILMTDYYLGKRYGKGIFF